MRKMAIDPRLPMETAVPRAPSLGMVSWVTTLAWRKYGSVLWKMSRLRRDPVLYQALRIRYAESRDYADTYSMVTKERTVFNFVTMGNISSRPVVLGPNSPEAAADRRGCFGRNTLCWEERLPCTQDRQG